MRAASSMVGLLVLALCASPALAQPTPAEIEASKKAAAEAANGALQAYGAGKYEEAIAGFRKAEAAFHAPKFLLYVARSQIKLGKLLAAKSTYEAILDEKLTSYAPPEFFTAQADAKKELAELSPRIPTLELRVAGGLTAVAVDGQPAVKGQASSLDPGEHTVSATGPGVPEVTRKVTLKEGERRVETLEPPAAPAPTTSTSTTAGGAPTAPTATVGPLTTATPSATGAPATAAGPGFFSSIPTATYVAYGVGAAGLIVGGVFGGLTLGKKSDYDALRSLEGADPREVNQVASEGRTLGLVTDIGFLVGIAGVATGTIVWLVSPRDPRPSPSGARDPSSARAPAREAPQRTMFVSARPGGVTAGGTF